MMLCLPNALGRSGEFDGTCRRLKTYYIVLIDIMSTRCLTAATDCTYYIALL